MTRAKDEMREQRITMEAVVDAYDSSERAMGWYYYLDGKMKVPFKARCSSLGPSPFLRSKTKWKSSAWRRKRSATAKCLSGFDGPASELPFRWRNCDHCRKIKRPRRRSVIGSTGWIAGTSCEPHKGSLVFGLFAG